MTVLQAVVLAIVQGITEFLPISSSAHLALVPKFTGWPDQGLAFDVALHFGTLLAVIVYFFRDWVQLFAQGFGLRWGGDEGLAKQPMMLWYLALATLPVAITGVMFKDAVETTLRSPYVIGGMLIGVGLLMGWADRVCRRDRDLSQISFTDALIIGVTQALAIVPGTSRSGITITAALFRHIERSSAARFSFLLSTPAIGGAAVKSLYDLIQEGGLEESTIGPLLIGIAVSAVTGWLVISLFLEFLRRNSLKTFVVYRVVFGIIVIALAAASAF